MKLKDFCIVFVLLLGFQSFAQNDTTYYKKYSERLVVGGFFATRSYESEFGQKMTTLNPFSTNVSYKADADLLSGVEIAYDKLALSIGFRTQPASDAFTKGKTSYSNFSLSFGSKWLLEASYRFYKGFYDRNTAGYDTTYKPGLPYFQNPSMSILTYRLKFLYFFNNQKFSYPAAYSFNTRQFKSSFTWALVSNLYYSATETDSSFLPKQLRPYYYDYKYFNDLNVVGASFGGGASATLVLFKRFFINALFVVGAESQWRTYNYLTRPNQNLNYWVVTGDIRAALGFNSRNFYMALTTSNDISSYENSAIVMKNTFVSALLHIGYRFKVKEPKFMTTVRANKIYQWF